MTASCNCTPDRRSGHAGVCTLHAGGVQVGVGLVCTRVIHVHVRVNTNLWRASPWAWEERKESQNPKLFLFVCLFWSFDFSSFYMYLNCEEGCADWWPLQFRLARVLGEALRRASQRRVTRTGTKARTERTKAAIPNVSPAVGRRRHAKQIRIFFFCINVTSTCRNHCVSRFCRNFLSENNNP